MKETFDFYNSTSIKSYNLDEKIRYQLKMLEGLDNFTRKHTENVQFIVPLVHSYMILVNCLFHLLFYKNLVN